MPLLEPTLPMLEEKATLAELESQVREWDDELALLAEVLLSKPKVSPPADNSKSMRD